MAFERIIIPNSTATINVTYNGFTPQAQAAFQHAVDIWQSLIISPVTIQVQANWVPNTNPVNLGSANPAKFETDFTGAPLANIQYPAALANSLASQDLDANRVDITTNFNSNRTDWYLGVDGNVPTGQFDLVSTVLHELGHALGFTDSFNFDITSGQGRRADNPYIFDQFIENGAGQNLTDTTHFPNNSTQLGNALISNNLFLDSPEIRAVNNGNPASLFAPTGWIAGSSIAHLENIYNGTIDALMTPTLRPQEVIRQPGAVTFRLFQNMGWRMNTDGWLYGTSSSEILIGTAANQNLFGLEGNDTLYAREGNDAIYGCAGEDYLYGESGNDILDGGDENDVLDGGAGDDTTFGGQGNDKYYIDSVNDTVTELVDEGTDIVYSPISYVLGNNLENLNLLEIGGSTNGTGNGERNIITGNQANNFLDGKGNDDILYGNAGNDSLYGGDGNDTLYGDTDNDLLVGGFGNDVIDGGSGTDTVRYGDSSGITINLDEINSYQAPGRYIYSSSSSSSINGFDVALGSSIAPGTALDSLGNQDTLRNLEDIIGSNFDDVLIGNSIGNSIQGLTGNDILMGNAGNDTLDGGAGIDLVSYRYAPLAVTVNLTQNTATDGLNGTDQILNLENIQGSNFSDTLIGNLQINWLFGGIGNDTLAASGGNDILYGETDNDLLSGEDGNDTLMGGQGADVLNGGNGIDTASYLTALTGVIANLANASTNRGDAQGDTFLSIENLVGSRYGDTLTGNSQNNHLWGLEGHDNLNGLGGNDTLEGGLGNDIYRIDSLTATILEYLNQGTDTINASISYTIGANLENLNLLEGTAARDGTGNSLNNIITGNSADNILNGGGGNDFLYGNAGTDSLLGGDGDDWLLGGNGNDILTGGNGNNTFVYKAITDAGDQISDFKVGNDKLNLTDVVNSSGWRSSNLFADGFLMTLQASSGMAALMIDPDGRGTAYRPAPFILFNNVSASALGNMSNFVV